MGTALAHRPEKPRPYSVTPPGTPQVRVLHIPYDYTQLADAKHTLFWLSPGSTIVNWVLNLDPHRPEWIFIIDVSKEALDIESENVHNSSFDFRTMLGGTNQF